MKKCELLIIGAGPAGLSAAIEAASQGVKVLMIDSNEKAGGQLFKQIHKFFGSSMHRAGTRGMDIGTELLNICKEKGVEIWLDTLAIGIYDDNKVAVEKKTGFNTTEMIIVCPEKILIATGASENAVRFPGWTLPGVMGAGAAQTMINFHRVLPGKNVLALGSGNVGLIVSYQLMQAGAHIEGIVEAQTKINGYAVHASKLTREGVPIYTGYTIVEARGEDRLEEVVIGKVNPDWSIVKGTEKTIKADTVVIAAGLKPLTGIAKMAGCELTFDRMLGGWAPIHDASMETSVEGIYVAGDATGVEEANTAIEEGKIAGIAIAEALGHITEEEKVKMNDAAWKRLAGLREGAHGEERVKAKARQISACEEYREKEGVQSCV